MNREFMADKQCGGNFDWVFPFSLLNTIRQGDYYLLTDDFDSCKRQPQRFPIYMLTCSGCQISKRCAWSTKHTKTVQNGLRRASGRQPKQVVSHDWVFHSSITNILYLSNRWASSAPTGPFRTMLRNIGTSRARRLSKLNYAAKR